MLLAEALAARKDTIKAIEKLTERLRAAAVRYEDQPAPVDDVVVVEDRLQAALDRLEGLTVAIHRANNETRVRFDDRDMTVMEAIALRERLVLEAKARRGVVDAVEQAVAPGRGGRGYLGGRPSKDDVRELPTVDLTEQRQAADGLSESVRRLDLALQQRDWTTELQT